ncbi:MAG: hypothetical protein DMG78_17990 [Acidobacteria bacterium]|nr:MAG: hypothetical protein DMG78_17990 [Acidobacteriota bacterium]
MSAFCFRNGIYVVTAKASWRSGHLWGAKHHHATKAANISWVENSIYIMGPTRDRFPPRLFRSVNVQGT